MLQWLQASWPRLLYAAAAIAIALLISRLLEGAVRRAVVARATKGVADSVAKLVRYSVLAAAALAALASLGVDVTGAIVAGGFLGIVVGFAAQASISNFVSGLLLLAERPFKIGDVISVGGDVGVVKEVGILSTTVVTWDGVRVRVPSSQLFNSSLKNYTASRARLVSVEVQIPYSASIERAVGAIESKLRGQWYVLEEPEPRAFAKAFASDGITLEVRAWAPGPAWFTLYSSLPRLVKEALDEAGIEIPYPQRVVWFASPLKTEGAAK